MEHFSAALAAHTRHLQKADCSIKEVFIMDTILNVKLKRYINKIERLQSLAKAGKLQLG